MVHLSVWCPVSRIISRLCKYAADLKADSFCVTGLSDSLPEVNIPSDQFTNSSGNYNWSPAVPLTVAEMKKFLVTPRDFSVTFDCAGTLVTIPCHFVPESFWTVEAPVTPDGKEYPLNGEWMGVEACFPEAVGTMASLILPLTEDDIATLRERNDKKNRNEFTDDIQPVEYRTAWNIGLLVKDSSFFFYGPAVSNLAIPEAKFSIPLYKDYKDPRDPRYVNFYIATKTKELHDDWMSWVYSEPKEKSELDDGWKVLYVDQNDPERSWPVVIAQNTVLDIYQKASPQIDYQSFLIALKLVAYIQGELPEKGFELVYSPEERIIRIPIKLVNDKWRIGADALDLYYQYVERNNRVNQIFERFSADEKGLIFAKSDKETAYITSRGSANAACFVLSLAFSVTTKLKGCLSDFFIIFDRLSSLGAIIHSNDKFPHFEGTTASNTTFTFTATLIRGLTTGTLKFSDVTTIDGDDEGSLYLVGYDNGDSKQEGPDHWIVGGKSGGRLVCLYDPYRSDTTVHAGTILDSLLGRNNSETVIRKITWEGK